MRIVIDALAASRGGLATYVQGLLSGWTKIAPSDDLTVLVTHPFETTLGHGDTDSPYRLVTCRSRQPNLLWRLGRTELVLPRLQRRADVLLATLPVIPALWRKPSIAIVYDLRHEDVPSDFALQKRIARSLWYSSTYRRADALIAVSERTARDLRSRRPMTDRRLSVVPLAADHVPRRLSTREGDVIAFGHLAHKEPLLLLEAWAEVLRDPAIPMRQLRILGLGPAERTALGSTIATLGIADRVVCEPYVGAMQLNQLMHAASAVVLPSRYEGFGLPVLEAMRQGVPVVISPDEALREVAAGYATCATDWTPTAFARSIRVALSMTQQAVSSAQRHADGFRWEYTAALTRAKAVDVLASR